MPQSLAVVLIHLVYSTKNRQPFLNPEFDPELYAYQGAIFREMDCPALIINGTADLNKYQIEYDERYVWD
jgi:putative transposase